jgi:hypothetical protein
MHSCVTKTNGVGNPRLRYLRILTTPFHIHTQSHFRNHLGRMTTSLTLIRKHRSAYIINASHLFFAVPRHAHAMCTKSPSKSIRHNRQEISSRSRIQKREKLPKINKEVSQVQMHGSVVRPSKSCLCTVPTQTPCPILYPNIYYISQPSSDPTPGA